LRQGLDQLVSQGKNAQTGTGTNPPPTTGGGKQTPPALTGQLAQAADQLDAAIEDVKKAQQSGNFAQYGAALQRLETAMTNFQNAQKAANGSTAPTAGPSASAPSSPEPTPSS
jgi:uncharacterized membrane protein (UPF0182 family)